MPFPLIADVDKKLNETFGVYGEKKMCGRTYMGTFRTTFIINEEGVIEEIFTPKTNKGKGACRTNIEIRSRIKTNCETNKRIAKLRKNNS